MNPPASSTLTARWFSPCTRLARQPSTSKPKSSSASGEAATNGESCSCRTRLCAFFLSLRRRLCSCRTIHFLVREPHRKDNSLPQLPISCLLVFPRQLTPSQGALISNSTCIRSEAPPCSILPCPPCKGGGCISRITGHRRRRQPYRDECQRRPVLAAAVRTTLVCSVQGDVVWVQARAEEQVKALLEADGQLIGREKEAADQLGSNR